MELVHESRLVARGRVADSGRDRGRIRSGAIGRHLGNARAELVPEGDPNIGDGIAGRGVGHTPRDGSRKRSSLAFDVDGLARRQVPRLTGLGGKPQTIDLHHQLEDVVPVQAVQLELEKAQLREHPGHPPIHVSHGSRVAIGDLEQPSELVVEFFEKYPVGLSGTRSS